MTVHTIQMYMVVCDFDGCDTCTDDLGHEYAAWVDADQAVDDWDNAGGVKLADGRFFCAEHADRVCLECESEADPAFLTEHDMCPTCLEADQ